MSAPKLTLSQLIEHAKARVAAMSTEEYATMIQMQRESFARAMAPCEHGILDWEDCPDCRRAALEATHADE